MHAAPLKEVFKSLSSSEKGLSEKQVSQRLEKYGKNLFRKEKTISPFIIFLKQFTDLLVIILIVAMVIAFLLGEIVDAVIIGVILVLNATFAFVQEYKAEKAIQLLKKMAPHKAKVRRNGKIIEIDASEVVPGDILILESGDKIAADARLIKCVSLYVDEASLTGESVPVAKKIDILPNKTILADRKNMVFASTIITSGRAEAIVTATGYETEIGKIATLVQTIDISKTPLQKSLAKLAKWLALIVGIIAVLVFVLGYFWSHNLFEMMLTSISLSVAAIPEGLPAVVTITLALGVKQMLKRKALVRRLKAVETLGSVTVICSDKTGTITRNEMTVTEIYANNKLFNVTGKGYSIEGHFLFKGKKIDPYPLELLLTAAASCNNATVNVGDPTEIALVVAAAKAKIKGREDRVKEVPFDSNKKFMTTTHKDGTTFIKGAPEKILAMCDYISIEGKKRRLISRDKERIEKQIERMGNDALRVLAIATSKKGMKGLEFLGLMAMLDPPRKEVMAAINLCRIAGIRPIMITGDNLATAKAIAAKVNIKGKAMSGTDLEFLNSEQLCKVVKEVNIFARVSSEQKVLILDALQKNGEIVAMTGDGVNDAPALKKSNIGIAMSVKGTDLSRDVADMILLDDSFATIVVAVKSGREIYDNIKKFLKFLLSANAGEVALIFSSILVGLPLPILPVQILWLNLITDGLPALALAVDPPCNGLMQRKPRHPNETIFHGIKNFLVIATIIAFLVSLGTFLLFYFTGPLDKARTMVFMVIIFFELWLVFSCRSEKQPIWKIGLFSNKYLVGAVAISILLQLLILYTPLATFFKVVPLGLTDWVYIILVSSLGFVFFEVKKFVLMKLNR
ncbi:MAG: cation-translocating P-type ATPase [archaeon]